MDNPPIGTDYPRCLYKAVASPTGGSPVIEQTIVQDVEHERTLEQQGFVHGPDLALTALAHGTPTSAPATPAAPAEVVIAHVPDAPPTPSPHHERSHKRHA